MPIIVEGLNPNACRGLKFVFKFDGAIVGHAFLYILRNDLHERPFGLLEDLQVDEKFRRRGFARQLAAEIIEATRAYDCYKIIATSRHSRPHVHSLYRQLGFKDHGLEFRLDFD